MLVRHPRPCLPNQHVCSLVRTPQFRWLCGLVSQSPGQPGAGPGLQESTLVLKCCATVLSEMCSPPSSTQEGTPNATQNFYPKRACNPHNRHGSYRGQPCGGAERLTHWVPRSPLPPPHQPPPHSICILGRREASQAAFWVTAG